MISLVSHQCNDNKQQANCILWLTVLVQNSIVVKCGLTIEVCIVYIIFKYDHYYRHVYLYISLCYGSLWWITKVIDSDNCHNYSLLESFLIKQTKRKTNKQKTTTEWHGCHESFTHTHKQTKKWSPCQKILEQFRCKLDNSFPICTNKNRFVEKKSSKREF